jgi:flagellin-like protein
MKRMLRSRKGVSPVIAAMLMIVVAIIGMSFLFAFAVNYAADFQLGRGSAVLESMVIENVWVRNSTLGGNSTVWIWVYNVGEVDLEISNIFVNDYKASINYVEQVNDGDLVHELDPPFEVGVGEHVMFSVNSTSLGNDGYNLFKLVTARGSAVEERY